LHKLQHKGLQFELNASEIAAFSDKLQGKTFVVSGVFTKHSRDEIVNMIEKNGGKNTGSVSAKTSYIVAGENMGPAKLEKAKKLNVPIISEDEFLDMIK
jgi:DNA ligase (NAD+)